MMRRPGRLRVAPIERAWRALCSKPRSRSYMAFGAVLALGAPPTPANLTLLSVVVFAVLGWVVGRSFDRVRLLSITDPLTGLFNRRDFERRVEEEESRHRRHGHPASVLCIDIDGLKAINDGFGHRAGDRAIVAVGRILLRSVRAVDSVARVGGDEFAILLPETSARKAAVLAQRIARHVADHDEESIRGLTVSIGITELDATGQAESPDALAVADAALYRAKAAGGGHIAMAGIPEPSPSLSPHASFVEGARLIDG
jgi:diguanylate cyclase (GGDEF)-like protein